MENYTHDDKENYSNPRREGKLHNLDEKDSDEIQVLEHPIWECEDDDLVDLTSATYTSSTLAPPCSSVRTLSRPSSGNPASYLTILDSIPSSSDSDATMHFMNCANG